MKHLFQARPEVREVPPSPRHKTIGIMMYLKYSSFRKRELNGLNLQDLISRALYTRGAKGFTGISYIEIYDEQSNILSISLYECC